MKRVIISIVVAGSMLTFCGCEENKDVYEELNAETVFVLKDKVTYRINAFVKDVNGKVHHFRGELTVVTDKYGRPTSLYFKGYYDGKYVPGSLIIFYTKDNQNYGEFDPSTGITDVFEDLYEALLEGIEKE